MTSLPEFFAWLDGYCENIERAPSEKQWKRVIGKINEVRGLPPPTQQQETNVVPIAPLVESSVQAVSTKALERSWLSEVEAHLLMGGVADPVGAMRDVRIDLNVSAESVAKQIIERERQAA